jgi:hypothetical protein
LFGFEARFKRDPTFPKLTPDDEPVDDQRASGDQQGDGKLSDACQP